MLCSSEATKRNREDGDRSEARLAWCRFGDLNGFFAGFYRVFGVYYTVYWWFGVLGSVLKGIQDMQARQNHTFQRASLVHVVPSPEP